ncbi:hypothetical protein Nepgr_000764 [Nepenthes gracilis]|uniref:Uncharacterized protein n=1 Tax=Nepenthes gracilis TaxID=150966 RepID=A0AAD3RX36_NEPGR|nr:hypothetical protein Nepgr_000764 [Nepenthes gracilis]
MAVGIQWSSQGPKWVRIFSEKDLSYRRRAATEAAVAVKLMGKYLLIRPRKMTLPLLLLPLQTPVRQMTRPPVALPLRLFAPLASFLERVVL